KLVPSAGEGDPTVEGERARALPLAQKLGMPALARCWQMLLKGLGEVQLAPSPLQAAEMVLVRLAYVADLPPPAELVRALGEDGAVPAASTRPVPKNSAAPPPQATRSALAAQPAPRTEPAPRAEAAAQPDAAPAAPQSFAPQSFTEVVELFAQHREAVLRSHLWSHCHLVRFEPGRIELRLAEPAPRDLPNRLGQLLGEWTGTRWVVSVSAAEGEPTLQEQAEAHRRILRSEAEEHPIVRAVLEIFPGARIEAVRELEPLAPAAAGEPGETTADGVDDE